MRVRCIAIAVGISLLSLASPAHAQTYSRTVKLAKGKAKVQFTPGVAEATPTAARKPPRVGIAPSPNASFGNFLAKRLDNTGRIAVVPSSRLQRAYAFINGFEELMRSDLVALVASTCRESTLDYLLLMGTPQASSKTDITAMIFFVGRMRMRNLQESRLYDCKSRQTVWVQSVLFETSQGALSMATGGISGSLFGGPEAEEAMAGVYADKLTADMKW